jgi:NodT family efflux transporter outer membrane factor (OMF) lipoprotein
MKRTAAVFAAAAVLPACSLAPPYRVPDTPPPPAAYRAADHWHPAQPGDTAPRGPWWSVFKDSALDAFEARLTGANQDVLAALARLREARADTRIARADRLPALSAAGSATRARVSPNSPRFPADTETTGNDFDLEGDVSYEFDLWGRVRNEVAAARAAQRASAADLATLELSVRAELAIDYFTLRSDDASQVLFDRTVAAYERSLQLVRNLHEGGAAAEADVAQAETQLETARTQAAENRLQRDQTEHAIAVLLGANPSDFHVDAAPLAAQVVPPPIDPGLPSALLERRPDVAAAERRVAAANAAIGIARAAYFPEFSLTGALGFNSIAASNWLTAPSRFWSAGPAAALPLFEGGRLAAETARARATYDEQAANYRSTVLVAYREVEDALTALGRLERESVSAEAAADAAAAALRQANYRYRGGLATYLEVVTTENASLQARLSAESIQLRRLNAAVLLIKALGGGWQSGES